MTVAKAVGIPDEHLSIFKVTCWEDNTAAETLANLDPGQSTPRSKFYDVKVHWFRSHLSSFHSSSSFKSVAMPSLGSFLLRRLQSSSYVEH